MDEPFSSLLHFTICILYELEVLIHCIYYICVRDCEQAELLPDSVCPIHLPTMQVFHDLSHKTILYLKLQVPPGAIKSIKRSSIGALISQWGSFYNIMV
jgi:hypothetical protein